MKNLSLITTTLVPLVVTFVVTGMMHPILVHGLDQERQMKKNKSSKSSKSKKSAERVITMWWVLFNKPSECEGHDGSSKPGEPVCEVSDLMNSAKTGTNDPQIAVFHASGGIPKNGSLRMVASIYKTQCDLDLVSSSDNGHYLWGGPGVLYDLGNASSFGYCPAAGEETQVHVVIRDHGPPTENKLWQLTRFTDPSCSKEGGPNLCSDVGAVAFGAMNDDGMTERSIGGFPAFPAGCSEAGTCTEEQELIQLYKGSKATLIRTGDAYQVVADIKVPFV